MIQLHFLHQEPRWWPLRTTRGWLALERTWRKFGVSLETVTKKCSGGWSQLGLNWLTKKPKCAVYESEESGNHHPRGTMHHQPNIRYLGVMLDTRLNFKAHIQYVAAKAARVANALARPMPNKSGPRQPRRKPLASVVTSILKYWIAIWGGALKIVKYRRKMAAVNRLSGLRVSSAFRTVSDDAVCIIAGLWPIEILAVERKQLDEQRSSILGEQEELKKIMRQDSLQRWQEKWDASEKGRWTHRLIPQVDNWVNRKHGEVNYYLTQMLSNHGCFRAYHYRFRHDESPECLAGYRLPEDAENVFFWFQRFAGERKELEERLGSSLTPETVVEWC